MNHRLSTTRSARSRGRTLLSIDKNYARRVDTLYRKAFEAPGAIADEATRKRCRLAVMQELDGVCTVFLTHNDSSWPPTREQLKVVPTQGMLQHTELTSLQGFQVLYPQDYISVNQANGMPSGREPESDSSGDDSVTPLKQPKRLDHGAEARVLTLVSEVTRDASPPPVGQAFGQKRERRSEKSMEKVFSPSKECSDSTRGVRDIDTMDTYDFSCSPDRDALTMEPVTPQRRRVDNRHASAFEKHGSLKTTSPILPREASRHDCFDVVSIDPSVLCTPQNKGRVVAPATGTSSDYGHRTRLPIRRDGSVSPSPRRRRAGVWRTYRAKGDDS
jgi:hypothetical protein